MNLSDLEIDWFARQIVIPGVGATGQAKLLRSTIAICGNPIAVQAATSYAEAAGPKIVDIGRAATPSCIVCAGLDEIDGDTISRLNAAPAPLIWYAISDSRLQGGIVRPGRSLPVLRGTAVQDPLPAQHRLAAIDAIGTAVCLILDWPIPETFEVALA